MVVNFPSIGKEQEGNVFIWWVGEKWKPNAVNICQVLESTNTAFDCCAEKSQIKQIKERNGKKNFLRPILSSSGLYNLKNLICLVNYILFECLECGRNTAV